MDEESIPSKSKSSDNSEKRSRDAIFKKVFRYFRKFIINDITEFPNFKTLENNKDPQLFKNILEQYVDLKYQEADRDQMVTILQCIVDPRNTYAKIDKKHNRLKASVLSLLLNYRKKKLAVLSQSKEL